MSVPIEAINNILACYAGSLNINCFYVIWFQQNEESRDENKQG